MGYRELMRRKLLERMYDKMSDEDKRTFVQLTMQDKDHLEIMHALQGQEIKLDQIKKAQSWWLDLSSNVAGNIIYEFASSMLSKLSRHF